jgi:DNA invertase Pin-like site-specific DNA recombinase
LKGTISELELHTIRRRLTAGLLAKAERGELALTLPIGLMRDPTGMVVKDPDLAVRERLKLVFEAFLKFRTVAKVMRVLDDRRLDLLAAIVMAIRAGPARQSHRCPRS